MFKSSLVAVVLLAGVPIASLSWVPAAVSAPAGVTRAHHSASHHRWFLRAVADILDGKVSRVR